MKKAIVFFSILICFVCFANTALAVEPTEGYYQYADGDTNILPVWTKLPNLPENHKYFILFRSGAATFMLSSTTPFNVRNNKSIGIDEDGYISACYLSWAGPNNSHWAKGSSNNKFYAAGSTVNAPPDVIVWSSHPVVSPDGSISLPGDKNFFTMAEAIQAVVNRTLKLETVPQTRETMGLLTACGVGLMALLMGLHLLSKKSLLYLGR